MKTVRTVEALRTIVRGWRSAGDRVGFVPTMGNLHAGHLSLIQLAQQRAPRSVASIFVNPTQFGPAEDFDAYPRTLENDRRRLTRAGVDLLFAPAVEEMYPHGINSATTVSVPELSTILDGAARPGHFDGVTTVVARLFNILQPDVAVFGQKDYQQLVIIRRMVADLKFAVEVVAGPTQRDPDGLALSSRNQYLTAAERARAPSLYAALVACREALQQGDSDHAGLEKAAVSKLLKVGFAPDYVAIRDATDLGAPSPRKPLVVLAAARLGRARLIDNVLVER